MKIWQTKPAAHSHPVLSSVVKLLSAFFLYIAIQFPVTAQIKLSDGRQIQFAAMDKFLEEQLDSLKLPALSVAFISDGKIVYHRALGIANLNTRKKVNDQSLFEAASLSKPLFAYWVMQMAEKGILNLDKPLFEYLPFPEIAHDARYKRITARMVLDHTTGFPNWRWYDRAPPEMKVKNDDMYMLYAPGTFSYSGEGYHYLGRVIAHLNGTTLKGLDALFQKQVATPLGMKHSYYSWHDYIRNHKVIGYYQGDKPFVKNWPTAGPYEDSTFFGAASTLHTEAVNYARFLIAVIEGKGLSQKSIDEMLNMQSRIPDSLSAMWGDIKGWSLGFAVEPTEHGIRYSHGGDNGGFQAGCMFYRKQKNGYVFFTNCDRSGLFYVKLRTFLGEMKEPVSK